MKPLQRMERIERMELALTEWNAKRALSPIEKRLETARIGGVTLLRERTAPSSAYYNRIKGFGPDDLPRLDELLARYGDGSPCFDLTPDGITFEVARALGERGYAPAEQLAFLYADVQELQEIEGAPEHIQLEKVTEDTAEEFIRWISESNGGMDITEEMIQRTKGYFHAPHFINYLIRSGGEPAAMGSLFLDGEEGYLANDYTFENFRGKGCQTELIKQRLYDASRLGITAVYTDVQFGTTSHANMEKAGFRLAYMNTVWMKG